MNLAAQFDSVRKQIDTACVRAGRDPGTVGLLVVTKGHPPEVVRAGAHGVAVIREVMSAPDPRAAVERLLRGLQ